MSSYPHQNVIDTNLYKYLWTLTKNGITPLQVVTQDDFTEVCTVHLAGNRMYIEGKFYPIFEWKIHGQDKGILECTARTDILWHVLGFSNFEICFMLFEGKIEGFCDWVKGGLFEEQEVYEKKILLFVDE